MDLDFLSVASYKVLWLVHEDLKWDLGDSLGKWLTENTGEGTWWPKQLPNSNLTWADRPIPNYRPDHVPQVQNRTSLPQLYCLCEGKKDQVGSGTAIPLQWPYKDYVYCVDLSGGRSRDLLYWVFNHVLGSSEKQAPHCSPMEFTWKRLYYVSYRAILQ